MARNWIGIAFGIGLLTLLGCSTGYRTPAPAVSLASLASADDDIATRMSRKPAATFPVRMAVARVQSASHNRSWSNQTGFELVGVRSTEESTAARKLSELPQVQSVAVLNRLLVPDKMESARSLRLAAAELKADVILVYTLDTRFIVDNVEIGPLQLVALGLIPTQTARVTATASAAVFDVRSGYVYGLSEASAVKKQIANAWNTSEAIDQSRERAEAAAVQQLLKEFTGVWKGVADEYARH